MNNHQQKQSVPGLYADVYNHMRELEMFTNQFPTVMFWLNEATGGAPMKFKKRNAVLMGRIEQKENELMELHVEKDEQGNFWRKADYPGTQYKFKSAEDSQAFQTAWQEFLQTKCNYEV